MKHFIIGIVIVVSLCVLGIVYQSNNSVEFLPGDTNENSELIV